MSDIYDRQRNYADLARSLDKLAEMPERTTREDLRRTASALLDASNDVKQLMNAQPKGCTCRHMEDDGRSWVVYDRQCQHHRHLQERIDDAEKRYKEAEKKLEQGLRTEFYIAAIQGLLASRTDPPTAKVLADRAMEIAEAAVARLRQ